MKYNPLFFHLHNSLETEDILFWIELAKLQQGMCLELACGTGRVLIPLAQEGYQVIGLDINFESLTFLREQLSPQLARAVNIIQADMSAFHFVQKFSLVYLACNTLSTIEKNVRQQVYKRINKHLVENGIFAASIPNPLRLEDLADSSESILEEIIYHPETGDPIQVSSEWKKHGRQIIFQWHYDRLLPGGQVERYSIENKQIIESPEEYLNDLRTDQLIPVEIFGDFDKSAFEADSPYFIVLARKASNDFMQ